MDQIVAYSSDKLMFIFHCLDGDLFTYNDVVMNMSIIQKGIEADKITNSFFVPYERRIVAAAIILQEFNQSDITARHAFYQAIGVRDNSIGKKTYKEIFHSIRIDNSIDRIDKKTLIQIIGFVQLVGCNSTLYNPRNLLSMDQTLHNLIQYHDDFLIKGDFLENPDRRFGDKNYEIEVLYRYYQMINGDSGYCIEIRNMVEYLTIDENPELIKALLDIKASKDLFIERPKDLLINVPVESWKMMKW